MHWLLDSYYWFTGARDEGGRAYGLWSGFGGAVPDFLILGGLVTYYRQHTCAHKPCRKWAHHVTPAGYKLCKTHLKEPVEKLVLPEIHADHT
jgi:hypothetical protein